MQVPRFSPRIFLIETAPRAALCISGRGEQEENVCTARRPPRQLLRAASRSSGRVSALAALPCPCPVCHHRQTDRQRRINPSRHQAERTVHPSP